MKKTSLQYRISVLNKIKKILIEVFGDLISSAIVYGSTLGDDFCEFSDYDILLIVDNPNIDFLKKIKKIKKNFFKKNIVIDFNIHRTSDLPKVRKDLFWHNNRALYIQKEFDLYGRVLIGKNPFRVNKIDNFFMLREAVKVVNSLVYQSRKLIVNRKLNNVGKILMMKWCIYASLYALASKGVYPKSKKSALSVFNKYFDTPINPEIFLYLKIGNIKEINMNDVAKAYDYLNYLDRNLFAEYEKRKFKKRVSHNGANPN